MRGADEENRQYFRRAYEAGSHGWQATEPSPYVARNLARVTERAAGRRLLDLGCGEGRHCLLAARMGFLPVGLDYEPAALRRAQAIARGAGLARGVQWLVGDIFALPFAPSSFDVVVDYGCLHHQKKSDWPRYRAAVLAALKPAGYFLLSTFSTAFRVYGPQERRWHLAHGAYRRFFTTADLDQLFAADFEFLDMEEERDERRGFWHALMKRRAQPSARGGDISLRRRRERMEWRGWAERLTEVLGLKRAPVAVIYTDTAAEGAATGKCRVCGALRDAAQGAVLDLSAENSACPGGSHYLGLRAQAPEHAEALREFLIHGEKLFCSPAAVYRSMALSEVKPPFGMAGHVVFSPLARAEECPDLVVFLCSAWQAARLINLAYFETGMPMQCDPTGSLCRSAITYPLVTGKVNVTFGDVTARRSEKYPEDELMVSLPYVQLRSVVGSLDRCSAGTAKAEIPPAMRRLMEESGAELPEL